MVYYFLHPSFEMAPVQTTFDPKDVTVVFVLGKFLLLSKRIIFQKNNNQRLDKLMQYKIGGPGAGKGTQCKFIKRDFDFVHLSGWFNALALEIFFVTNLFIKLAIY